MLGIPTSISVNDFKPAVFDSKDPTVLVMTADRFLTRYYIYILQSGIPNAGISLSYISEVSTHLSCILEVI